MKKVNFDLVIDRLGTYCTQWDYIEDRFGEKDLLPFSVSDTDFAVPEEVQETLERRIGHGIFGYTRWNHSEFKSAVTGWYQQRFGADFPEDWILYSPTVMFSVAKLIELVSAPGEQVLIQTPAYDGFFKIILDNGRRICTNPLRMEQGIYQLDFEDLEAKLAQPDTKVFLLCSPHNPTGRVWSLEELTRIYQLCRKYGVFLISDEIHMDIIRSCKTQISILNLETGDSRAGYAVCSSASKTFNTAGLVCSYLMVPDEDIRDAFLLTLKNKNALSSVSILGMEATITAYRECAYWVDALNNYITGNLLCTQRYLERKIPQLKFQIPDATYLAWIDTAGLHMPMAQLQDALIHQAKVAIMPGETYGKEGESYIRLNLGCPRSKLEQGLNKLKMGVEYAKAKSSSIS